ncbi:ParB N-terminal domain-containing protein [Mycobacterium sp. 236(2023)]|uniref:ParB/RepB/Spo0J family partition protein n=1 Tax=Mycobacterium sp. 236(2023) TaxID=3038163 RepID=UPI002414E777|nr:ParB N-terminal domain-containing protein [Mycobacterium sp. 236(2023)]MDG4667929.1 ParB N-terminal domain-containing protein [Mycobacterium sp. 236(2023)]
MSGTSTTTEGLTHDHGAIAHLDPTTIVIGDNVRDLPTLNDAFVSSVREHGVLQPITALRDSGTGQVTVLDGQLRTLAAREAGLATIPVYVRDDTAADTKVAVAARVAHQIVTNDQRSALTDAQRARGIQQMLDAGVTAAKVAKRLAVPKDTVAAARAVTASTRAMDALDDGQLSLAEAAALTEFDEDPDAISRLLGAAGRPQFAHIVAALRQERQSAQAYDDAATAWRDRGFTVLDSAPLWRDTGCVALRYLRRDGETVTDAVVTDPAHWAALLEETASFVDRDTGEPVAEDDIDFDTERDPDTEAADGLRHFRTVIEKPTFAPQYFCLDHDAAGLDLVEYLANTNPATPSDPNPGEENGSTDEAEPSDVQRRDRRKVLALNRLGTAAQQVRRDFVTKLLTRKTPPKGAAIFMAECLTRDGYLLTQHNGADLAAELLGLADADAVRDTVAKLGASGDGRAQMLTLALVLAALEARTPKDAWRNAATSAGVSGHWARSVTTVDYLTFLAANGYTLAPIEQVASAALSADELFDRDNTDG